MYTETPHNVQDLLRGAPDASAGAVFPVEGHGSLSVQEICRPGIGGEKGLRQQLWPEKGFLEDSKTRVAHPDDAHSKTTSRRTGTALPCHRAKNQNSGQLQRC